MDIKNKICSLEGGTFYENNSLVPGHGGKFRGSATKLPIQQLEKPCPMNRPGIGRKMDLLGWKKWLQLIDSINAYVRMRGGTLFYLL